MDELGFNKIAAAVLVTALGFMGLKKLSHSALHVSVPDVPAYALEIETGPATSGEPVILPFPTTEWVAAMDEARGAKVFKKCTSCHNADAGGANGTGPNLYGVVGAAAGVHSGFGYSSAMSQSGLTWDYETLDKYLKKPTKFLSGTAMNFVGLKKETDRAAVIAYLRAQSETPLPMPVPAAIPVTEASAEGVTDMAVDAMNEGAATVIETVEGGADALVDGAKDAMGAAEKVAGDTKEAAGDLLEKAKEIVKETPKAGDSQ